ncbi:MAG: MmgE/PrpD family protein [Betaproteobacteria bacterium]|nr:MmgE/PrpD family protein [Betaproteobacteria bacterium]
MTTSATRAQPASAADARSISQSIAEHVVGCDYAALPASSITAAKTLMLDTLAVGWAGTTAPGAPEAHALLKDEGGRADSSLWGFGGKLPAAAATFLNSISGGALDYDGVNTVHADIVALPAALAIAEREHASGKEFLAAYMIGSDLCSRFGGSITGAHKGWFTTSIYGAFGAAAAAAKLLKLDATATRHALGIALSQSAGTQQSNIEQALTKRLQGALSARAGVFSAQLAQRGITAPREAIEGKFGLYALYQEGNPLKVLDGLGQRFEHENTAIKKYPCCACSHASLEAALGLIREHDLKPDDVTAIEVTHSTFMHRLVGAPFNPGDNPQVSAQFSVQYALACALLRRRMSVADLEDSAILDPAIKPVTERIRIVVDETLKSSRAPASVKIVSRKHGTLARTTETFPWSPDDPPTATALQDKNDACFAAGIAPLDAVRKAKLVERVQKIEAVTDMSRFFDGIL